MFKSILDTLLNCILLYSNLVNCTKHVVIYGVQSSNDPVGAIKINWNNLPIAEGMIVQINAGAEYAAIVAKLDNQTGAVLIIGYFVDPSPIYMRIYHGTWYV